MSLICLKYFSGPLLSFRMEFLFKSLSESFVTLPHFPYLPLVQDDLFTAVLKFVNLGMLCFFSTSPIISCFTVSVRVPFIYPAQIFLQHLSTLRTQYHTWFIISSNQHLLLYWKLIANRNIYFNLVCVNSASW